MKLTGTNRPITYTTHHPANELQKRLHHGAGKKKNKTACVHYVVPKQQTKPVSCREQNHNYITTPQLPRSTGTNVVTTRFPHPAAQPTGDGYKGYGGHSVGETPGPIPNPEAKTHSADGTAPGRVWESRSPPDTI